MLIGAVGASGLVGGITHDLGYSAAAASAGDTNEAGVPKSSAPAQPVPGGVGGANPSGGTDASAAPVRTQFSGEEYTSRSETPRSLTGGASPSPAPTLDAAKDGSFGNLERTTEQPWLTLLIAGVALFAVSAVLRFSIAPGAG